MSPMCRCRPTSRFATTVGTRAPRLACTHPGPVILAVIELVEETPAGRNSLRAGQAFRRPARETHNVKNVSAKLARVLAIHVDPAQ